MDKSKIEYLIDLQRVKKLESLLLPMAKRNLECTPKEDYTHSMFWNKYEELKMEYYELTGREYGKKKI